MRTSLLIYAIVFSSNIFCQNWSVVQPSVTYNYKHEDSTLISHQVRVDRIQSNAVADTYTLNEVYYHSDTLGELPFFLKQVIETNEQYLFQGDSIAHSLSKTNILNDTFIINSLDSTVCWIDTIFSNSIWQTTDSFRHYQCSNNETITLSKRNGITQFDWMEKEYQLVGIQGTNKGEQVIGWKEIYNFQVGDIFQYRDYSASHSDPGGSIRNEISKRRVTHKRLEENRYMYSFEVTSSHENSNGRKVYQMSNLEFSSIKFFGESELGMQNLIFQQDLSLDNPCDDKFPATFYRLDHLNNAQLQIIRSDQNVDFEKTEKVFANQQGLIYRTEGCFEYLYEFELLGLIRNGDTFGTITSDSVLINTSINNLNQKPLTIEVHPVPTTSELNFQLKATNEFNLKIFNSNGTLVLHQTCRGTNENHQVDVNKLNQGLYILLITKLDGTKYTQQFIKE